MASRLFRASRRNLFTFFERPEIPWYEPNKGCSIFLSSEQLHDHLRQHDAVCHMLNRHVSGTKFESQQLWSILTSSAFDAQHAAVFNAASSHWSHSFFWRCLQPGGVRVPSYLHRAIDKDFGGMTRLVQRFSEVAISTHGSSWVWLVYSPLDRKMDVIATTGSVCPPVQGLVPLLGLDMWEHSHYIDYRGVRSEYITAFWSNVNWDFVAENLMRATSTALSKHYSVGRVSTHHHVPGHPERLPWLTESLDVSNASSRLGARPGDIRGVMEQSTTFKPLVDNPQTTPGVESPEMWPRVYKINPGEIIANVPDWL
eukprot:TRINITY_DN56325_c0_g1_i1.p1 TRINITY_DN56325_c0_g1~~TRINITY_DN56325_c0_g1_i1.p1  ORF type:complete len:313 (+),score=37.77 TRINITY_DN56325_c0_g1_i1:131-1069(+)